MNKITQIMSKDAESFARLSGGRSQVMSMDGQCRALRSEIDKKIKEKGYTLLKVSELSGVNQGHLSMVLNGNPPRPMTVEQLDKLAAAFGEEPGWLYDLYYEECFKSENGKLRSGGERLSNKRVRSYLVRCAELNRLDYVESIIAKMLDTPRVALALLYDVAEELYAKGQVQAAVPFYQYVIENEKDNYAERFIMSQYRMFRASIGRDAQKNWEAVIAFSPFRKRLQEHLQLEALHYLGNVCYSLYQWRRAEQYADELRELATTVYQYMIRERKKGNDPKLSPSEFPLVAYYGEGYLMKGNVLERCKRYTEALQYVQGYENLDWFEVVDEAGLLFIEKFKLWARGNLYTLEVSRGNEDAVEPYAAYLAEHPPELLPGLNPILMSASEYGFCVDHVLDRFSKQISQLKDSGSIIYMERLLNFLYNYAKYEFMRQRFGRGIDGILRCLKLSFHNNQPGSAYRSMMLFEKYRQYASEQQRKLYHSITDGSKTLHMYNHGAGLEM